MGEHTAFEVGPDLSLHEPGDGRALPSRPSEEGLELLANDFVEKGLLGLVAFVPVDGEGSSGTGSKRRGERSQSRPLGSAQASGEPAGTLRLPDQVKNPGA